MEYQLHMAQHFQYHVVNGTKFLFDPMTRKQLFKFTTNIYRGLPILQGLDRNVFVKNEVTGNPRFVYDRDLQFGIQDATLLDEMTGAGTAGPVNSDGLIYALNNPMITFTRAFGIPTIQQNVYSRIPGRTDNVNKLAIKTS